MARVAVAAKPAILVALGGIALGVLGWGVRKALQRRQAKDLLPQVDVAAWNDASLVAP